MSIASTSTHRFPASHPVSKVVLLVAVIALAFWIASFFPDLILALILSALAAFVLSPVVTALEGRFSMRRIPAIVVTFVTVGGTFVYLLIAAGPLILHRLLAIHEQLSRFPFEAKLIEVSRNLEQSLPFINAESAARTVQGMIEGATDAAGSTLQNSFGTIATLLIVPFVTYFILADGHRAYSALIERVPNRYFEMTLNVIHKIQSQLVGYLKGWILDSMIVGILSIVGLSIVGVQYAFIIGVLTGIANLVPYLGPIVGATLAILVSLTQVGTFEMVVPIIIMTIIIRLIDDFVVQPLCFARSVNMHPLTVILLLLVGHETLGVGGMLLAIPLATIIKVSTVETYWGLRNYRITA
jgi:predicted PurR-regulated permease PerM